VARLRLEPVQLDGSGSLADRDEIARVFERLSLEHRTVIVLHHYLGLTVDEAATTIGIPVGTAKSRLHYATEAMRAALEADARRVSAGEAMA
jgi:RNA polymerase sigma-70 factor, ECF subfamily